MDDELILVSRSSLPKYVKPEDLYSFSWICREEESNTRKIVKQEMGKLGIDCDSFDLRSVVTSSTAVKQTILKSPIIDNIPIVSIISRHMIIDEIEKGELFCARIKGVKIMRKLYLAYLRDRKLDPFMDNVISYITTKRR
jgi:DNA-binding transcriptional LysR family regulator